MGYNARNADFATLCDRANSTSNLSLVRVNREQKERRLVITEGVAAHSKLMAKTLALS